VEILDPAGNVVACFAGPKERVAAGIMGVIAGRFLSGRGGAAKLSAERHADQRGESTL
jgi:hypothetical protein